MKNILLIVLLTIFSTPTLMAQSKLKSIWNSALNKSDTNENNEIEEEFEEEKPEKEKKKKEKQKETSQLTQVQEAAKPINQNNYSWAEDQKLYSYLINEKKDYLKAIQVGKLMLDKTENAEVKEPYQIGQSHSCLGMAYFYAGDHLTAHHHLLKSAEISEKLYGGSSMALANDFTKIANNYISLGFKEEATSYLKTAIDIKLSYLGASNEQVKTLVQQYNGLISKNDIVPSSDKNNELKTEQKIVKKPTENKEVVTPKIQETRIDTLYIFQKDTIVIIKNINSESSNSVEQIDDAYREEFIQEAINKFNEQNTHTVTGISEEEKQQLINQVTEKIHSSTDNIPSPKTDTLIIENRTSSIDTIIATSTITSYELDKKTRDEIIKEIYTKVKADYPLIKGKNDTITITHHLSPNEKENLANQVIANLNNSNEVKKSVKESTTNLYHTVKKGDSLYGISLKYNVTIEALKSFNNLVSNNLKIGTRLRVK